jgi:hypothetical protein
MDSTSITRTREVALKDFSGGLNNYWDPSSISDNEVAALINMDFTPNGALQSRPPIVNSGFDVPVAGEYVNILGYFMTSAGVRYIVATTDTKTWVFNTVSPAWTQIWAFKATGYAQYAEEVVLSKASTGGTRWNPSTGSTAIATMPALDGLLIYRDRMFGWGVQGTSTQTTFYYSNVITLADPTGVYTWDTANNVIVVGRGDGQAITMMIADTDKIIIFKSASTYIFTYLASGIATSGQIDLFQAGIGAENKESVAAYRNGYVVLHDQTLYKMQNNGFTPLNSQQVTFSSKASTPAYKKNFALSVFGDRAIVWFSGNIYVINLLTGTWSQWESTTDLAYIKQMPPISTEVLTNEIGYGVTGSGTSAKWLIYKIVNSPVTSSTAESFTCKLKTKIYDFGTPVEWKRLYWWAADISAAGTVTTKAYVVALSGTNTTFDTLDLTTWDELDTRNWDRLSDADAVVTTSRTISGDIAQRSLLKLENALRFRRIYFEVYLNCDGTSATAPAQIFTLTPMIGIKAKMTQGVS